MIPFKDINVRKVLHWRALNDMNRIWKSNMSSAFKKRLFVATAESIMVYGCESWSLTAAMERSLNGTYTRMLLKGLKYIGPLSPPMCNYMKSCPQLPIKLHPGH